MRVIVCGWSFYFWWAPIIHAHGTLSLEAPSRNISSKNISSYFCLADAKRSVLQYSASAATTSLVSFFYLTSAIGFYFRKILITPRTTQLYPFTDQPSTLVSQQNLYSCFVLRWVTVDSFHMLWPLGPPWLPRSTPTGEEGRFGQWPRVRYSLP